MPTAAPRTWLILGDKAGDNAQVRIIADALGWPYQLKELVFQARYVLGKPRFAPRYTMSIRHDRLLSSRRGRISF